MKRVVNVFSNLDYNTCSSFAFTDGEFGSEDKNHIIVTASPLQVSGNAWIPRICGYNSTVSENTYFPVSTTEKSRYMTVMSFFFMLYVSTYWVVMIYMHHEKCRITVNL